MKSSVLLVVVTINLISSTHSASMSSKPLGGTCQHLNDKDPPRVSCYSYTEIPTDIPFPGTVKYLEMSKGNVIDTLTNGSLIRSYLHSLKSLDLDNCKIRVIEPGAFAGIDTLAHIYLGSNLINVLNPDVFTDVKSLEGLSIENNPISIIEHGKIFPNMKELIYLDLSNCKLQDIPENVFDNLVSLRVLNLTGNQFKRLDWRVLQGTSKLVQLYLEGNPWHCDCHVKFLMETMKKMGIAKQFENTTCASNEANMYSWGAILWNDIRDDGMKCEPKIDELVYSSWSRTNEHGDELNIDKSVQLGENVFFECEYSGFPRPKVQWYKGIEPIKKNDNNNMLPATTQANIQHKFEFMDDLSVNLPSWEQGGRNFNHKFREILVVRGFQIEDKGSYSCGLVDTYDKERVYLRDIKTETNIPCKEVGDATLKMWMLMFAGLIVGFMIAGITVFIWIQVGKQDERGTNKEPGIDLEEFDGKPIIPQVHLSLKPDDTDTSLF